MKKLKPFTLLAVLHGAVIIIALALLWRQPGEHPRDRETIVVMPVEGIISMESGGMGRGGSADDIASAIDRLTERSDVKALVLKINSPGGSVGAVQAIHSAVLRFRKSGKIVVSSFGDVAASGGYYVAAGGDRIVTYPGTLTGSIGVVMQLPNVTGLMQKIGVRMESVTSGALKDAGSPFREMTANEQKYFKELVLDAYAQFFDAVKSGRNMPAADLTKVADGRVMSGRAAVEVKLADKVGSLTDAIELAKELSGLSAKNPRIVYHHEKPTLGKFLELLSRNPVDRALQFTDTGARLAYIFN